MSKPRGRLKFRFEIFKRDAFTCRYCGRKPPVVILHVDHVVAVANGGGDNIENLVTSCSECNLGKSATPMEDCMNQIQPNIDVEREKKEQLRQYNIFLIKCRRIHDQWLREVIVFWAKLENQNPDEVFISQDREATIRRFLRYMAASEIIDALQITCDRYGEIISCRARKYFYGVCWHKIKGKKPWEPTSALQPCPNAS